MEELNGLRVWTIGHSTRPWEEFLELLKANRIECVADVRRFPGSRKHPQYSGEALAQTLPQYGLVYLPIPELGGRRKPRPDSPNDAWRNPSFRGYADHMAGAEYATGRAKLIEVAQRLRAAVLCAEAVWWRCHRGLIADDLKAAGAEALHIIGPGQAAAHPYTSAARLSRSGLSYRTAE